MLTARCSAAGIVCFALMTGPLQAQPCELHWSDQFGSGDLNWNGWGQSLAIFDDGAGDALYVGGRFTQAGGIDVNGIARWDGTRFSALGEGLGQVVQVLDIEVFDDGTGPALHAAGAWQVDEEKSEFIARWSGETWSSLGPGLNGTAEEMVVFDDGRGSSLYVAGRFTEAGGAEAHHIARWNGRSWSPVGGGMDGAVLALEVFDDGSGPALYAAGIFATAGGVPAAYIARWDGRSWSPLGDGLNSAGRLDLAVFDDGTGPALYVCGAFTEAGGVPAARVARWDGRSWAGLGDGLDAGATALGVVDLGDGPALHVSGYFSTAGGVEVNHIARWDGRAWSALGEGLQSHAWAIAAFDDGAGVKLHAGGTFVFSGSGLITPYLARWDGDEWSSIDRGIYESSLLDQVVLDIAGHEGAPQELAGVYAAGRFAMAGGRPAGGIARWDGARWSSLGDQPPAPFDFDAVWSVVFYDDGNGAALYAGCEFPAERIARWDGRQWTAVGGGIGGAAVQTLRVYDDGSGEALYAAGRFSSAGGLPVTNFARWDGASWSDVGGGLDGDQPVHVRALAAFDDGSGPALYAGGKFDSAGAVEAINVVRWDGGSWSPVGEGLPASPGGGGSEGVWGFAVFDDGSGPALYAGGYILVDSASSDPVQGLARWDSTAWSPVDGWQTSSVRSLQVFDDGAAGAPALYVGGYPMRAGGLRPESLLRFDGSTWSAGAGSILRTSDNYPYANVTALGVFDDGHGNGPALFIGGRFDFTGGQSAHNFGQLIGCASAVFGDQDGDADVDADDLAALIDAWGRCPDVPAACRGDLDGDGAVSTADLLVLLRSWD